MAGLPADLSGPVAGITRPGGSVYRRLLAVPGTLSFFAATVPARLGGAMTGLALLWLVHDAGGSYERAGLVTGAFTLASALSGPLVSRQIDRYGPSRAVPVLASVHLLALTGVVLVTLGPDAGPAGGVPAMTATAALAGAAELRIGALAAARWSRLLPGGPLLPAAFALEAFSTDAAFVAGPAVTGLLAALVRPVAAVAAAGALTLLGAVAVTAQRRTAPPPTRAQPAAHGARRPRGAGTRLMTGSFATVLAVNLALGVMFGATGVSVTAFAQRQHAPAAAGFVYGVLGATSMLSALIYARRDVPVPPRHQVTDAMVVLAIGYLPLLVVDRTWALAVALVLPGVALGPTVVLSSVLAQAAAPPDRLTQAFTTVSSVNALGLAGAAAVAGRLGDRYGPALGFVPAQVALAVVAIAVTVAPTATVVRRVRRSVAGRRGRPSPRR